MKEDNFKVNIHPRRIQRENDEREYYFFNPIPPNKSVYGKRSEVRMGRILSKLPMKKVVLTEDNEAWEWGFEGGEMIWMFLYSFRTFTNEQKPQIKMKKKTEKPCNWSREELHLLHIMEWQDQYPNATEDEYYYPTDLVRIIDFSITHQGEEFWYEIYDYYMGFAYNLFKS